MRRLIYLLLSFSLLAACGDRQSVPRGPLGKADRAGSCAKPEGGDYCGGKSAETCWCDDLCESYGDCCDDKKPVCDEEPPPPPPTERTIEVIHTDPHCDICDSGDKDILRAASPVIKRVVGLLGQAQSSVEIGQFTFSVTEIKQAIIDAHNREGVTVRMVMDQSQDRSGSVARELRDQHGVDVRFQKGTFAGYERDRETGEYKLDENGQRIPRYGLVHSKFMVIDKTTVLTGSNNWSSTGTTFNEENTMVITANQADPIIAGFSCHFEALWNGSTEDSGACSNTEQGIAFAPSSAGYKMIRDALRESKSNVKVMMHHLTNEKLIKELIKLRERPVGQKVDVLVVVNEAERNTDYDSSRWRELIDEGAKLRFKRNNEGMHQLMHNKLVIIDDTILINGSGNWSGPGFFNNYENYVVYTEPAVVRSFAQMFERLWIWSLSADSLDNNRSAAQQHALETSVYFGNLHAHAPLAAGAKMLDDGKAQRADSQGELQTINLGESVDEVARNAFAYARDVGGLDFMAISPHCTDESESDGPTMANMSEAGYQELRLAANAMTSSSFLAIAAMEWSTNSRGNHVNILGSSAISKVERGRFDTLYDAFLPAQAAAGDRPFVMLNHPKTFRLNQESLNGSWDQEFGINLTDIPKSGERKQKFNDYGLDDYAPVKDVLPDWIAGLVPPDVVAVAAALENMRVAAGPYMRLMEVLLNRGNEFSGTDSRNPSLVPDEETQQIIRRTKVHTDWDYYLAHGFKVAPVASHDNHFANWGTGHSSRTAIVAKALSMANLYHAIDTRRVYASEDENLELKFHADGRVPMGSSMRTRHANVGLRLEVRDPDYDGAYQLKVYLGTVGGSVVEVRTDNLAEDGEINVQVTLPAAGKHFVYIEVFEVDANRMAWTAPVWIERL